MDETSVCLELAYKQTLEVKGAQHFGVISSNKEKSRIMVVLSIGYCPYRTNRPICKFPLMIILRKQKPRSSKLERPAKTVYENEDIDKLVKQKGILVVQSFSGWMDSYLMANDYVPHLRSHLPTGVNPLLMMFDNFSARGTDETIEALEKAKIDFMHLPQNCTAIIQPLDVGVNVSFKSRIRSKFEQWIIEKFDEVVHQKPYANQKYHKAAGPVRLSSG